MSIDFMSINKGRNFSTGKDVKSASGRVPEKQSPELRKHFSTSAYAPVQDDRPCWYVTFTANVQWLEESSVNLQNFVVEMMLMFHLNVKGTLVHCSAKIQRPVESGAYGKFLTAAVVFKPCLPENLSIR